MALKRSQLKALVKECLVEILEEGLGGAGLVEAAAPRPRRKGSTRRSGPKRMRRGHPALDTPVTQRPNPELAERVRSAAGGDSIMESIFADTAATTLQAQNGAGHANLQGGGGFADGAAMAMAQADPTEIFGEAADMWGTLAFGDGAPQQRADRPVPPPVAPAPPPSALPAAGSAPTPRSMVPPPDFDPYGSVDDLIVPDP